jgi:histidinol-phosphate aminotransferase
VDEAIHLLCSTYLESGDEAVIVVPTFAMYGIFARAEGACVVGVPAKENFQFPLEQLLSRISERTGVIAVANPNNPTGAAVAGDVLLKVAQAAPQAAVLVDEAYFEFHGETIIDHTRRVPNLFVARTLSKAYGLAGLRIGILAGNQQQMASVRRVASPYNVNAVALAVVSEALKDRDYVERYATDVRRNRDCLERELRGLDLHYWPSHANFVLVRVGAAHTEFVNALRARGILVRDRHSDPGCEGCVRLTVGPDEHTATLIAALREVVEELGLRREVRA